MKKIMLVTLFLNLFFCTNAQVEMEYFKPVFLMKEAYQKTEIVAYTALDDKLYLAIKAVKAQKKKTFILLKATCKGKILTSREVFYDDILALSIGSDSSIVLVVKTKKQKKLIKYNSINDPISWDIPLPLTRYDALAINKEGIVMVLSDTLLSCFNNKGQVKWKMNLVNKTNHLEAILALKNGNFVFTNAGVINGIDATGNTIWKLGENTNTIQWQKIIQLRAGQMMAIGMDSSDIVATPYPIPYAWCIEENGSKIDWIHHFGEGEEQQQLHAVAEDIQGRLSFLLEKNKHYQLYMLEKKGEECQHYLLPSQYNTAVLKQLLIDSISNYTAFGHDNDQVVFQHFKQKIKLESQLPNLFMLAVAVGKNNEMAAENAIELYKNQKNKLFNYTDMQLLTDSCNTTAGELAKAFELLSTKNIQKNDLVIIYLAGHGITIENDFIWQASDYNPAAARTSSLRMSQLIKDLDNLPAKKIFFINPVTTSTRAINYEYPDDIALVNLNNSSEALPNQLFSNEIMTKADRNKDDYTTLEEWLNYLKIKQRHALISNNSILFKQ